jgi:hypothetical protein
VYARDKFKTSLMGSKIKENVSQKSKCRTQNMSYNICCVHYQRYYCLAESVEDKGFPISVTNSIFTHS